MLMTGYISLLLSIWYNLIWGQRADYLTLDKVGLVLTKIGNIKPKSFHKLMGEIFPFVLCCSSGDGMSGNV